MIMGGKQGLCTEQPAVADILHYSPRNRQPVESTCSPSDLIQDQQALRCRVPQDVRHFCHLHHKSTLTGSEVIGSTDSRKYPV